MNSLILSLGAANEELMTKAHSWWESAASIQRIDLAGFDAQAPFDTRVAWAMSNGMEIGTVYSRYSTKLQSSTDDQVRENVQWAARHNIYVPPELISVDEGVKGKTVRRSGLDRTKVILGERVAKVLLVYKVSRLFRQAGKGYQFVNEEVVERELRAVSVSQGIDTLDRKTWKLQLQIHGIMDDMLLDAIADHVRSGLKGLFLKRWTTGAIGIGYRRKEIKDAPLTKLERPRTIPEVDPEAAILIREHAQLLLDGMSIRQGVHRWNASNGPIDPRSTTGKISHTAYRRLFSNSRLVGKWEFGRRRNQFSSRLDSVRQIQQTDDDVESLQIEDLRILDDETFYSLQAIFNGRKTGPRGPREEKRVQLWDLTTEFFNCASCSKPGEPVRLYQTGANGTLMQCKNGDECETKSAVRRDEAVKAICRKLTELIARDSQLIEMTLEKSQNLDANVDVHLESKIDQARKRLQLLGNRINDLFDMSGEGSADARKEIKDRLRAAQSERSGVQLELHHLEKAIEGTTSTLSVEQIRDMLSDMSKLLIDAASGDLGKDAVFKVLSVFRSLTGGSIFVHGEKRAARKRKNIIGSFRPRVIQSILTDSNQSNLLDTEPEEVKIWLREPPRMDAIAERVHHLMDEMGMSYRDAAKQLQQEGHHVNSGNTWYSYRRWYEMQGTEPPKLPFNSGEKRLLA